jgi:hypothetical protein
MKKISLLFMLLVFVTGFSYSQSSQPGNKKHPIQKNHPTGTPRRAHRMVKAGGKDSVKAMNDPMTKIWIHGEDTTKTATPVTRKPSTRSTGKPALKKRS